MAIKHSLSDIGNMVLDIVNREAKATREIIDQQSIHSLNLSAKEFRLELLKVKKRIENNIDIINSSKILDKDSPQDIDNLINILAKSSVQSLTKENVRFDYLNKVAADFKNELVAEVTDTATRERYRKLLKAMQLGHSSSSALSEKYRSDLAELSQLLTIVQKQEPSNPSEVSVQAKSEKMLISAIQQLRLSLKASTMIDSNKHTIISDSASVDASIDYFNKISSRLLSKASFGTFMLEYLPRYVNIHSSEKDMSKMSIKLSIENWMDNSEKGSFSKSLNRATNAIMVQVVSSGIDASQASRFKTNLARTKKELLAGYTEMSTKLKIRIMKQAGEAVSSVVTDIAASPTYKEYLQSVIIATIKGEKVRKVPRNSKKTVNKSIDSSKKVIETKKVTPITKKVSTSSSVPKTVSALRNLAGQFTSVTSLMTLMNQMLHETIKKNMQRPNLHYQTGRFAKSVKVEGITRARDGALTAFLSYMRYPYATFEAGGKQGHKGYYPSRLINESAREIATKLTKERFMSVTIK